MTVKLSSIALARSGDKGAHTNVGVIFYHKDIYLWAKDNLTINKIQNHFRDISKGKVVRYELDNLNSLNFILHDSLDGGGSESLLNDAQGKTYGQYLLTMEINLPENFKEYINE